MYIFFLEGEWLDSNEKLSDHIEQLQQPDVFLLIFFFLTKKTFLK